MSKWKDALEQLRHDPDHWKTLPPSIRKALRTRLLVTEEGQVIETTPEAFDGWRIQTWVRIGDDDKWVDQVSPFGEKMIYDTQEEAEKNARQLSLLNYRLFRVVQYTVASSFIVYDFGKRYTEDGTTNIRTLIEPDMFEQPDNDDVTEMYRIESRTAYSKGAKWEPPAPRDYLDMASAVEAALSLSKANPRREYRIVSGENGLSPEPAVYRGGDAFADTDMLQVLCDMVNPGDLAQALHSLLVLWLGEKPAHSLIHEMTGKVTP